MSTHVLKLDENFLGALARLSSGVREEGRKVTAVVLSDKLCATIASCIMAEQEPPEDLPIRHIFLALDLIYYAGYAGEFPPVGTLFGDIVVYSEHVNTPKELSLGLDEVLVYTT
ncbi:MULTISPECIES: hypothetical protein [Bacteria]|jgi:hypothetical protein|uniref:Uncharacterized protein n=7 Tax=root TaxID=1 RepID=A0A8S5UIK4_9CAUD|nr:hypothetical protein [Enterococcus faecium]ELG7156192.1 hypothetical protein [Staphylococcus aureus]DAF94108.1 MAG TPA: hypothetical protein [Myoviridae sp. ctu2j3]ELL1201021.1 hypothetical protein [Staphylococcus aureus]MDN3040475.1 hypothetical protein [Enterococcus faecium]MDN3050703.1 hypothetical protein [Enterococcus faecium]